MSIMRVKLALFWTACKCAGGEGVVAGNTAVLRLGILGPSGTQALGSLQIDMWKQTRAS